MAICLTASKSSFDAAGNPASIISAASLPSNIKLLVGGLGFKGGFENGREDWEMGFLGLMGWKRKWVCGLLQEEPLIKELISMANPYKELRYTHVFEEGELLGWGGYGSVVSSEYFIDGQKYAIKKVPIGGRTLYEDARREVQVLALLKHPHIVQYYTAWFESDIHGKMGPDSTGDLAELIDRGIGEEEGYRIFLEILEGVSFIHSQGIVHGDLAPKNIFLDKNNRVKLVTLVLVPLSRMGEGAKDDPWSRLKLVSSTCGDVFAAIVLVIDLKFLQVVGMFCCYCFGN
ncbi:hypothetical protein FNV43_RR00657 [Rhamnella rubrinervis]|uniref:Protein kinase domain-containing protein n=1 Tax=Rhamnella rubrinervis TaxID=2594499 RepID=A0A8K0HR30_9ROSA|nr:hypothetical protein FNV43_RR00657 [Rhamnella rubrinervis]